MGTRGRIADFDILLKSEQPTTATTSSNLWKNAVFCSKLTREIARQMTRIVQIVQG
jgi:hypothetical protein